MVQVKYLQYVFIYPYLLIILFLHVTPSDTQRSIPTHLWK